MSLPYISAMMALPSLAVIVSQYPIGMISDRFDRRSIILILATASFGVASFGALLGYLPKAWGANSAELLIAVMTAFGAISLPVYSLVIAHAADQMQRDQLLGASAKLVLIYGLGSLLGPILVGVVMQRLHAPGFMIFMAAAYGFMALHALHRRMVGVPSARSMPSDTLQAGPLTTPIAAKAIAEGKS